MVCQGAGCGRVFYICRSCWRGQAYCGDPCRTKAQVQQHRKANKKHQDSPEGRDDHRDRQRKYVRRCRGKMTDVGSPGPDRSGSIAKPDPQPKTRPRAARKIRVWDLRDPFPRRRRLIHIVCRRVAGIPKPPSIRSLILRFLSPNTPARPLRGRRSGEDGSDPPLWRVVLVMAVGPGGAPALSPVGGSLPSYLSLREGSEPKREAGSAEVPAAPCAPRRAPPGAGNRGAPGRWEKHSACRSAAR